MLSKTASRKKTGENSGNGTFLKDIGTINKGLYVDKTRPRVTSSTASSRSKTIRKSPLPEPQTKPKDTDNAKDSLDKYKKSIWSWKGLKSLTHIRNRRFNCSFSLQVHTIEGLPELFNDVNLVVYWKRRDGELMTRPVRVNKGVAKFEERLTHMCSVYGSRSLPHHSAKYESKHFLLYALACDAPQMDLGKHRVDLTRLLPLTLEELEDEKNSAKWTTSFRLSGKARGATMNVSFGYAVIGNKGNKLSGELDFKNELNVQCVGSVTASSSTSNLSAEDVKELHEVMSTTSSKISDSVKIHDQKLEEEKSSCSSNAVEERFQTESETTEGSVVEKEMEVEHGIEDLAKEHVKSHQVVTHLSPVEEIGCQKDEPLISDYSSKENDVSARESLMEELETVLTSNTDLANAGFEAQENESETPLVKSNYGDQEKGKSLSLDDVNESVASEFLDSLGIEHSPFGLRSEIGIEHSPFGLSSEIGIEHSPFGLSSESEPESPRERLLRQFEKEALASGSSLFNFDMDDDSSEFVYDDFHNSSIVEDFEEMTNNTEADEMSTKTRAAVLEDLETEALMREWGLNGDAFQHSPPNNSSAGFGTPIDTSYEDPQRLPPLAEGLGPFIQTKSGGFLRSMSPTLFKNAKNGGSLVMQVSSPVVVPAEMGSSITDILEGLASVGIEKLSMQANKLMPLEDITGKTMQQISWEASSNLEGPERQGLLQHELEHTQNISFLETRVEGKSSSSKVNKSGSSSLGSDGEYVSLEELAPFAMDKIEALSIEGLRIQSGMSDEEASSNISPQSIGGFSALTGKTVDVDSSLGLDGTGGLQLLDIKDNGEDIDGLMGLSLTLDEWMRLDSGEIDDNDLISEQTSKILAAHHATSLASFHGRSKGEKRRGKGRKCGLLGNNFTVALMVQLRDPSRNYELVGTPMLALIQVERVFASPKAKIYSTVSSFTNYYQEEEDSKTTKMQNITKAEEDKVQEEEEAVSQYKITEVHVAGLTTETSKTKLWGSSNQEKSGSRWLLANGMGKKKHPVMKSNAIANSSTPASLPAATTVQPRDSLWSISSRASGKEVRRIQNPYIRNPNVIFPKEKKRLW